MSGNNEYGCIHYGSGPEMMVSEDPQSPNTPLSETRNHTVKTEVLKNLFAEYNYMASFLFKALFEIKRALKKACENVKTVH